MTKEEEEAFAFYENEMYGDSEISEEEDLDDFTFPEDEADDIEKETETETETEGHFNWHCEKVGELFGATYFNVCPGWTGKGLAFPTGLPKMVKKERGKFICLFGYDVFDVWHLFDIKNSKKDFNAKLHDPKYVFKIKEIQSSTLIKHYGGNKMLIAPPIEYDNIIRTIERGKLTTLNHIRDVLAKKHGANFTCLPTSFNAMCMLVRATIQRQKDITPYWRVLKRGGELNKEYPGGIYLQRERLEEEGFKIVEKRYSSRYFVKDYKKYLAEL